MPVCLTLCLSGARLGQLFSVLVMVIGLPAALSAQAVSGPAETPPADFAAAQYVDSRGCAFARAAVNGQTRWVPRLGADRQPVCGLTPSLSAAPAASDAPAVAATPPAAPPAETAAPAPVGTAPSRPAPVAAPVASPPAVAQAPVQAPVQARPRQQRPRTAAAAPSPAAPAAAVVTPRPDFPTVPCPPGYPERGVICVERSVFDQIQSARATADSPRATPVAAAPAAPASAPAQTAGRYVQVGAFAVPSNAQNTIARLQSQGLPPVTRQARQRGRTLQLVLAGPFSSHAELRAALGTARAMGFSDAFIR